LQRAAKLSRHDHEQPNRTLICGRKNDVDPTGTSALDAHKAEESWLSCVVDGSIRPIYRIEKVIPHHPQNDPVPLGLPLSTCQGIAKSGDHWGVSIIDAKGACITLNLPPNPGRVSIPVARSGPANTPLFFFSARPCERTTDYRLSRATSRSSSDRLSEMVSIPTCPARARLLLV
jgi:hypothetical protein